MVKIECAENVWTSMNDNLPSIVFEACHNMILSDFGVQHYERFDSSVIDQAMEIAALTN